MSKGNRTRRRELGLLPEPSKCVGRKKDGTPCMRSPIKGAAVCRSHGGAAPQVRRKAAERIANAADIAVLQIIQLMQAPDTPSAIKLAAAKDLLDRVDVKGKTTVEVEVPAWQQLLDGIVAEVPEGADVSMREFHSPDSDPVVVVGSERVDDYTIDDADYCGAEAQGDALPEPWHAPTVEPHRARKAPVRPVVRGDDAHPPPRYAPTASGPRSRRNPRHR